MSLCLASTIVTCIILLIQSEITYFKQLVMNFIFGKALLSLLFYTDNLYLFTTFSKFLFLLFPYFSVDGHLKACPLYCRMSQREHSAIFLTFIKLPVVLKTFVLSIFEWSFYTGFTVICRLLSISCLILMKG